MDENKGSGSSDRGRIFELEKMHFFSAAYSTGKRIVDVDIEAVNNS